MRYLMVGLSCVGACRDGAHFLMHVWPTGSASGAWVAWGQLYIDSGEENDLHTGGEFVNFRAEVQPSGNGMLTGTFSSTGASCSHPSCDRSALLKLMLCSARQAQ